MDLKRNTQRTRKKHVTAIPGIEGYYGITIFGDELMNSSNNYPSQPFVG